MRFGVWIAFSRPAEPPHDGAAHYPVLVLFRQKRQFLSEVGDALLVSKLGEAVDAGGEVGAPKTAARAESVKQDRKSTRLNSSHQIISYAVFCFKKKKSTRSRVSTRT